MNEQELRQASDIADRLEELHRGKRFHAKQMEVFRAIFKDGKKRIRIRKGRKGGGTESIMYPAARIIGTLPNKAAYIIGPTQVQQSEIIWDNRRLHNFIPHEWGGEANEQQRRIRLGNGSFVKVDGAEDPKRSRGWEGDVFIWDELKDHNPLSLEACYPNVASRNALWIELGTPPTTKENYYYQHEQELLKDPDWAFFYWTAWDNPFLPGGHDWLKRERDKYYARGDGDLWEIEWEAKYVWNSRRKVLPKFDGSHIAPIEVINAETLRDKSHMKWITSIDPGYAECFAVLFLGYNPYTGQIYIVDEIYLKDRNKCAVPEVWPLIEKKQKQHFSGTWTNIYDNAALSFSVEVNSYLRDQGRSANLIPTIKQKGDEDEYFRAINTSYSDLGRVKVAKHCLGYIKEAENYETDEFDRYPDKNNHQLDNNRYIYKYLGITRELTQARIIVVSPRPRVYTPKDDWKAEELKNDFVGYGGEEAQFDPMKMFEG